LRTAMRRAKGLPLLLPERFRAGLAPSAIRRLRPDSL
jgi:hypothetical protein